jgi:predicted permease
VRNVLLKPLPYRDADRLIVIYESKTNPVDAGSFWEWQRSARGVAEMAMVSPWQNYNVSADAGQLPEKIEAAWCSWNFFSILGVQPLLGRSFTVSDDRPGTAATVLLTYPFWKRRYGSDPSVVGKTIWLDGKPYTVVGVLPSWFVYSGAFGGRSVQVWTPVSHEASRFLLDTFEDHEFQVIARLRPDTSLPRVVAELNAVQKAIAAAHPQPGVHSAVTGRTLLDDAVENYKTPLYAILAATGCLLLIACLNVASLLFARTAARSKELAIRAALGGSRIRLIRERLVESLLLSAAGGGVGVLAAWGALRWLMYARRDMNRIETIHIDGTVAAFTIAVIAACALFFGFISALSSGGPHILIALQQGLRAHRGGALRARARKFLLVLEFGLTVVLLVGAGLLLKSFRNLRTTDLGVPTDNVLTLSVSLPKVRYPQAAQQVAFFEQLIEGVRALAGVQAAGLVSTPPGEGWNGDRIMSVVEHPPLPKDRMPDIMVRGADPGYFAAIRIPLLRGRIFTTDERLDRAHVAVISQLAARQLFRGEDPIGKHLQSSISDDIYEIVGVVGDTRWNISEPMLPTLYWPIYGNDYSSATIVVHSSHDVESLSIPVQRVVSRLDADLPISDVMTLRQAIGNSTVDSEFDSILVLAFGVIALLLAAAGLYGVQAYLVTQRTGEIGIRIALGAQRKQMLRLLLVDGLRPAWFGLLLGLTASAGTARLIRSMLYETQPNDPAVFGAVTLTLVSVAMLACVVPARSALRLDPMWALRRE